MQAVVVYDGEHHGLRLRCYMMGRMTLGGNPLDRNNGLAASARNLMDLIGAGQVRPHRQKRSYRQRQKESLCVQHCSESG